MTRVIEIVLLVAVCAVVVISAQGATEGLLIRAAAPIVPRAQAMPVSAAEIHAAASAATWWFLGGAAALLAGRIVGSRRRTGVIEAPLLLPALVGLAGFGFVLQCGYDLAVLGIGPGGGRGWTGPPFARGFFVASVLGALLLASPWDPMLLLAKGRRLLLVALIGTFVALAVFGRGPSGAPDVKIILFGVQPVEAVKLGFVLFLADFLGRRAAKIRWQREGSTAFGRVLRWPRPRLVLPALAALLAILLGLKFIHDLGAILVLAAILYALFYVTTRSGGWAVVAACLVCGVVVVVVADPSIAGGTVEGRIRMWQDPWLNARPHGDQLAASLWALAAGGMDGRGLGLGAAGAVPAGHTDLILARLVEETGGFGIGLYVALLLSLLGSLAFVAARSRTPERALAAGGVATLLGVQFVIIAAGTAGLLPLTGIVVPFLSFGKSSMVAFVVGVAWVLRLAADGAARAESELLTEIGGGVLRTSLVGAAGVIGVSTFVGWTAVAAGPEISARSRVTTQKDGTLALDPNPRIRAIVRRMRRGEFLDRTGAALRTTPEPGRYEYPLGSALGTVLGPTQGSLQRPAWALERLHEIRLRGYPDLPDGPAAWRYREDGAPTLRTAFVAASSTELPGDRARAESIGALRAGGAAVADLRLVPLPRPDLTGFLPLLYLREQAYQEQVAALADDVTRRSVRLTLHAELQAQVAAVLQRAGQKGKAAAAVVIDVDRGEVLARAQFPDVDFSDPSWQDRVFPKEGTPDPAFVGPYGPWPDKTGARGVWQAGSIAKVFTSIAAARVGLGSGGSRCAVRTDHTFSCSERDGQGPSFRLSHWRRPIHDHSNDRIHGEIDLVSALAVSCNVFFGQLGLELGPDAFTSLARDGLEFRWDPTRPFDPGAAGSRELASTAFGQGASAFSVMQAARMVATVGAGGVYRRCPNSMELGAPCEERLLVDDPKKVAPILAGLRAVMEPGGTGARLEEPRGLRVYGKTGTADDPGKAEETPWGVVQGDEGAAPHSWFVALAEPSAASECDPVVPGRLAVAVVVPRGGAGSRAAGPAAMEILAAAQFLGLFGETSR